MLNCTPRTKFNLSNDVPLNKETVHTRAKNPNQNLLVAHCGPVSPMTAVEAHLLDVMLQFAALTAPTTPKIGLKIANSLVRGTATKVQIVEWKKKHGVTCAEDMNKTWTEVLANDLK